MVITVYVCQDCDCTRFWDTPSQNEAVIEKDKKCKCGMPMIKIKAEIIEEGVK